MLTYSDRLSLYQTYTNNSDTTNQTNGALFLNEGDRKVLSAYNWPFLEDTKTDLTEASVQFYPLPDDFKKLINVTITVSSQIYTPVEIVGRSNWDRLNQISNDSDFPSYYFIFNNQIGFYPKPSTAGNTITLHYRKFQKDLTLADYTTGTILTATNGDETIVGSGTSWTSKMVDRWLRIDDSNSANTGDGRWYQISSVTDGTNLELSYPYQGVSISGGSASYTIGQTSLIPEDYQILSVYWAAYRYWSSKANRKEKSDLFKQDFFDGLEEMRRMYVSRTDSYVANPESPEIINPNLTIML